MSSRMVLLLHNREVGSKSGSGTGCVVASLSFYVYRKTKSPRKTPRFA